MKLDRISMKISAYVKQKWLIVYLKVGCNIHFLYTFIHFQKIRYIEVSKFVIIYISLMNQVHIYIYVSWYFQKFLATIAPIVKAMSCEKPT